MAPMISASHDKGMRAWEEQCRVTISDGCWECGPMSGESLQVCKTIYADDVQETSVTETVAEPNAVHTVSSQLFDHELDSRGWAETETRKSTCFSFEARGQ